MEEPVIRTARTVEEAEELALKELGADRNEVEVEILSRGKAGFLGIGAELARVRVRRITEGGDMASFAMNTVNHILSASGISVTTNIRSANDEEVGGPIIDIVGEDSGLLIGRRGQTLQALQFMVNLIARNQHGDGTRIMLDVERYRQRREASLRDMAVRVASRVVQTGRNITLEPMNAADRRVIHVSLSDYQGVTTESVGLGDDRKVNIMASHE
ncbi:MAG: RNA-binding cell elongation regulator Jag/EloR [Chloroflexota bacterium]|nr:RNA-binding cell elongation regulator Jag/EloR [Chloroflexota bacterium]